MAYANSAKLAGYKRSACKRFRALRPIRLIFTEEKKQTFMEAVGGIYILWSTSDERIMALIAAHLSVNITRVITVLCLVSFPSPASCYFLRPSFGVNMISTNQNDICMAHILLLLFFFFCFFFFFFFFFLMRYIYI